MKENMLSRCKTLTADKLACIVLCVCAILRFVPIVMSMFVGINTKFDDAYLWYCIDYLQQGASLHDTTLANKLVATFFSEETTYRFFNLRCISLCISIIGAMLFYGITLCVLKKKNYITNAWQAISYLAIVLLLVGFQAASFDIYNTMSFTFLEVEIACMCWALADEKHAIWSCFFIGILGVLALVTIPPSGALVFLAIAVTLISYYWKNKQLLWKIVLSAFVGCMTAWLFIHLFVVNLVELVESYYNNAILLMTSNRGYSSSKQLLSLGFYIRNFLIIGMLFLGLWKIYEFLYAGISKWLAYVVFALSLIILYKYQVKPYFSYGSLVLYPCLAVCMLQIIEAIKKKSGVKEPLLMGVLIVLPLLSVIGTNVAYDHKIVNFLAPLAILVYVLIQRKEYRYILVCLLVFPTCVSIANMKWNIRDYTETSYSKLEHISILQTEKAYLAKVDSILEVTNYDAERDYFYASDYHQMAICMADGKMIMEMQVPNDFQVYPFKEDLRVPNYIFMNNWDSTVLYEEFQKLDWGFPQEYDKYPIVHPTYVDDPYGYLYCKKDSLK